MESFVHPGGLGNRPGREFACGRGGKERQSHPVLSEALQNVAARLAELVRHKGQSLVVGNALTAHVGSRMMKLPKAEDESDSIRQVTASLELPKLLAIERDRRAIQ